MTLAVTGARGFLGWHLACRYAAEHGEAPVRLGRDEFASVELLRAALAEVDTVVHVAGVNRADDDGDVEHDNVRLAQQLGEALAGRPVHIVYANSVQALADNPYGRGKARAGKLLAGLPGTMADVLLPNLFGEHGRPAYNSFVATFAHEVAAGRSPSVSGDREIALLHAQDAAALLLEAVGQRCDHVVRPAGEPHRITDVLERLRGYHSLYASRGEVPDLRDGFDRDLFNTYRSFLFPHLYPVFPQAYADDRGVLVESVRSHGGTGQGFVSTTKPGARRGDHYHLRKIERFMVVQGEAEIAVRRLFDDQVVRFRVSGDRPGFVDMPTMWTHNITNVGQSELVTAFWSDQLLDQHHPDQFPLAVETDERAIA